MASNAYGFSVDTVLTIEIAEEKVTELLQEEGFGVLTRIDIRNALRHKLNVEFRHYRILGACNPTLAHRALQAEPGIGLLLPCNVVVEQREEGGSRVSFLDPKAAFALVGNPELEAVADDAAARLGRVAARLSGEEN